MRPAYKLLLIIALASALAYAISWFPPYVGAATIIVLPVSMLIWVFYLIATHKEGEPAIVPAGSTIQWRDMVGGRSPSWWVFFPVEGDQTRYYKVYDHKLYLMGIGYTIAKDYEGIMVERP